MINTYANVFKYETSIMANYKVKIKKSFNKL